MKVLTVEGLSKRYPSFTLDGVSFSLTRGHITGFIGKNGAGKTTTLSSLFHLVNPDAGEVRFFGERYEEAECAIKARVGFVRGGVDYYKTKPLKTITAVTRAFYGTWDEAAYRRYMRLFQLDETKTPAMLSAGMRVKYSIALALSHRAELLILDEPTSGLDPVSREEVLDILLALAKEGVTVLFSTHIISDLERTADDILYIRDGRLVAASPLADFRAAYRTVRYAGEIPASDRPHLIGIRPGRDGVTALVAAEAPLSAESAPATLEEIMIHMEREGTPCDF